ncbi:MAG: sugar phosphate isomerase/epimerase family protein [Phycisphaerales bacterium JB063]
MSTPTRRQFIAATAATAAAATPGVASAAHAAKAGAAKLQDGDAGFPEPAEGTTFGAPYGQPLFKLSVAQWSLNQLFWDGDVDNRDYGKFVKETFDIDAVEWVNGFFKDKGTDYAYLREMKQRCDDAGVKTLLIMVDGEGQLGHPDANERKKTVENHYKWVVASKLLGGHSIRVNAGSSGSWDEQRDRAADGLHQLTEFARGFGINVIVENHGGLSSNGQWLSQVMDQVALPEVGTLPDFGNFRVGNDNEYDKYKGMYELMRYAKACSAKSWNFTQDGKHEAFDYRRIMRIVLASGYRGYVGVEYEGSSHGKVEGVRLTQRLLEACRDEMTA